jgi:Cu2+-exporting ATPase
MKETIIKVEGMVCNGCENRVKNALKNISGVEEVIADHTTGIVKVTSNEEVLENTITEKIEDLGFDIVKEG